MQSLLKIVSVHNFQVYVLLISFIISGGGGNRPIYLLFALQNNEIEIMVKIKFIPKNYTVIYILPNYPNFDLGVSINTTIFIFGLKDGYVQNCGKHNRLSCCRWDR